MNEHDLKPGRVVAGALVIGGLLTLAFPAYVLSIIQVAIVSVAVVAGLSALASHVPPTGWLSPFKWMSPFGRRPGKGRRGGPDDIRAIRSRLARRRHRFPPAPPMPPETVALLRPLLRTALNLGPLDEPPPAWARDHLSSLSWAVLSADSTRRFHWFGALPPKPRQVAGIAATVLDDVDTLLAGTDRPLPSSAQGPS